MYTDHKFTVDKVKDAREIVLKWLKLTHENGWLHLIASDIEWYADQKAKNVALLYERFRQAIDMGEMPVGWTDMDAEVEEVLGRGLKV
jgi:hypothetical protein